MNTDNSEIRAIAETIRKTVECEKIYLFGSYAYGQPHEDSDLDFHVVLPDDSSLRRMRIIHQNLSSTNRMLPIDILAARRGRFEEMSTLPTMERQIASTDLRTAKHLYKTMYAKPFEIICCHCQ